MGRGLVAIVALPVISFIFLITVIGIPLGILGLVGFAGLMILGWILTPIVMGCAVYGYFSKQPYEVSWKTITLGVVIYTILGIIPFLGWIVQLLATLMTVGAIIVMKVDMMQEWR
jgi:hypothetical protein